MSVNSRDWSVFSKVFVPRTGWRFVNVEKGIILRGRPPWLKSCLSHLRSTMVWRLHLIQACRIFLAVYDDCWTMSNNCICTYCGILNLHNPDLSGYKTGIELDRCGQPTKYTRCHTRSKLKHIFIFLFSFFSFYFLTSFQHQLFTCFYFCLV